MTLLKSLRFASTNLHLASLRPTFWKSCIASPRLVSDEAKRSALTNLRFVSGSGVLTKMGDLYDSGFQGLSTLGFSIRMEDDQLAKQLVPVKSTHFTEFVLVEWDVSFTKGVWDKLPSLVSILLTDLVKLLQIQIEFGGIRTRINLYNVTTSDRIKHAITLLEMPPLRFMVLGLV